MQKSSISVFHGNTTGFSGAPELMEVQGGCCVTALWQWKYCGNFERPVLGTDEFSSPMHPNQGSPFFVLVCSSALFTWGLWKVDFILWSCYCNHLWRENWDSINVTFQRFVLIPVAETRTCASVSWDLLSHIFFNQVGGNPFVHRV